MALQENKQDFVDNFIKKFERPKWELECAELLSHASSHWLLSTDDFKIATEPPCGLITEITNFHEHEAFILMPAEDGISQMDLREIHQIIKELTMGIFVLNQLPMVTLEGNFDQSTTCQLPPAYLDTRVGQALINVDYMMKGLWHGVYFPREERLKFADRWRNNMDVNAHGIPETKKPLIDEFLSAGIKDVAKDTDYSGIYDSLEKKNASEGAINELKFFMKHVDDLAMQMTLFQRSVMQHRNLFIVNADWSVENTIFLTDDQLDKTGFDRLRARLQMQEQILQEYLPKKLEVRRELHILKFISFLVPFLMAMKKRMKIPIMSKTHFWLPSGLSNDKVRTERDLPPLMLSADCQCPNFDSETNFYFHLHGGIQIDHETPNPKPPPAEFSAKYEFVSNEIRKFLKDIIELESSEQDPYPMPILEIDGKMYFAIGIEFETFYPQSPQKPVWVQKRCEEISKLRPKRLPIPEIQAYDIFKKYYGSKKAMKINSDLPNKLKAAAQRGLVALFASLVRKCPPARLGKHDDDGMCMIHWAAMYNRPQIITNLITQAMDFNVKKITASASLQGPTPLHLAARCGSLLAVQCLVAVNAYLVATDQNGWAPIHHAAYFNHEQVIKLMLRKSDDLLELPTKDDNRTPLLLAACSGSYNALRCLIDCGAHVTSTDGHGNNVIELAAMNFHTNILEFFIDWDNPALPVWKTLVGMMKQQDIIKKDSSVKTIEILSSMKGDYWYDLVEAGGLAALIELLSVDNEEIQAVAVSVLCNISNNEPVKEKLSEINAIKILTHLLQSPIDDIQSRVAIVLADLAVYGNNQSSIASEDGISSLVQLLDSDVENVLVNTVNAIKVLSFKNPANQTLIGQLGAIKYLVEFLGIQSESLQAGSSSALAAVASGHLENQQIAVEEGAVQAVVKLLKGHNSRIQLRAAEALEALVDYNEPCQKAFLNPQFDTPAALIRLLKMLSVEIKEQGAFSLWALAGQRKTQQKLMAERIGIPQLIDMLVTATPPSEKLQYIGCLALNALAREDKNNQNKIAELDGIQAIARLLRSSKTSHRVMLSALRVLGTMCIGLAHTSNKVTQKRIADENTIALLVQVISDNRSEELRVEAAYTIACLVLANNDNREILKEQTPFRYALMFELLQSEDEENRLRACSAMAVFAYNNLAEQYIVYEAGGLSFNLFENFLQSDNEMHRCLAAFQIVVLARLITDLDQVTLTARGITVLVKLLSSKNDDTIVASGSALSSLAHIRPGISDAMVTLGALDLLVAHLESPNNEVRFTSAVTLGYLTSNRTAARLLLSQCRNSAHLFEKLMQNIGENPKISKEFLQDFERHQMVGLPRTASPTRQLTVDDTKRTGGNSRNRGNVSPDRNYSRVKSAPATSMRVQSASAKLTSAVNSTQRPLTTRPKTSKFRF